MDTALGGDRIRQLIPHAGTMCLLERVVEWTDAMIACRATSHTGADNPLRLNFETFEEPNNKRMAAVIQSMLRQAWIYLDVTAIDAAAHGENLRSNNYELGVASWFADFNDATNFLDLLRADSGNNYGRYRNPKFDALIARSQCDEVRLQIACDDFIRSSRVDHDNMDLTLGKSGLLLGCAQLLEAAPAEVATAPMITARTSRNAGEDRPDVPMNSMLPGTSLSGSGPHRALADSGSNSCPEYLRASWALPVMLYFACPYGLRE